MRKIIKIGLPILVFVLAVIFVYIQLNTPFKKIEKVFGINLPSSALIMNYEYNNLLLFPKESHLSAKLQIDNSDYSSFVASLHKYTKEEYDPLFAPHEELIYHWWDLDKTRVAGYYTKTFSRNMIFYQVKTARQSIYITNKTDDKRYIYLND